MIDKLFRKKTSQKSAELSAAIPDGLRIYAVGDIHGCRRKLEALLRRIEQDARGARASQLVFLGDYVDRGPDSRGVLEDLIALRDKRPDTVFLKGNHEAAMLDFLRDPEIMSAWLGWGGAETLASYGVENADERRPDDLAAALTAALPAPHRTFLGDLERYRVIGDYLFVHAGVRPGAPLEEQSDEDLFWIREDFHHAAPESRPQQVVVHGHHPVRKPLDVGWRIDVDTGACWSGALSAVVLEDRRRRFLSV